MNCISLWEPWATLIVVGAKQFETRSWSTPVRGPVLIHASKKWNGDLYDTVLNDPFSAVLVLAWGEGWRRHTLRQMPRPDTLGKILGVASIVQIWGTGYGDARELIRGQTRRKITEQEYAFGDYGVGRYAWELAEVRKFETPVPCTGHQGFFNVPNEVVAEQLAKAKAVPV